MTNRTIFGSCGQLTDEEKTLGRRIKEEVDTTDGYEGYYADMVQNFSGLAEHILDALRRSSGAILVLHERGHIVSEHGDDLGVRSSVWINQELAIFAYRQFFEGANIPILAFKHDSVDLEGAMSAFIINPKPLGNDEMVVEEVRNWLRTVAPQGRPSEQVVFDEKWENLEEIDRLILTALVDEGAHDIKEVSVRKRLIDSYGIDQNTASTLVRTRRTVLSTSNLVTLNKNLFDGDEMGLHLAWEWYVRHAVAKK